MKSKYKVDIPCFVSIENIEDRTSIIEYLENLGLVPISAKTKSYIESCSNHIVVVDSYFSSGREDALEISRLLEYEAMDCHMDIELFKLIVKNYFTH